jgi:hypothetical protein
MHAMPSKHMTLQGVPYYPGMILEGDMMAEEELKQLESHREEVSSSPLVPVDDGS